MREASGTLDGRSRVSGDGGAGSGAAKADKTTGPLPLGWRPWQAVAAMSLIGSGGSRGGCDDKSAGLQVRGIGTSEPLVVTKGAS